MVWEIYVLWKEIKNHDQAKLTWETHNIKTGTIQRLAWPLHRDAMQMCETVIFLKTHDQGMHKLEKKMTTVPGIRDIGIELRYGDLFESYTVTTGKQGTWVLPSSQD